jgi:hypothetical protein
MTYAAPVLMQPSVEAVTDFSEDALEGRAVR